MMIANETTGVLVFSNPETYPKNQSVECTANSVPLIMQWYSAFHADDFYMVTFKGHNVRMDNNGCMMPSQILELS